jgi:hypothetical protein
MIRGKQLMSKKCGLICNLKGAIIYNCYKTKLGRYSAMKLDNNFLLQSRSLSDGFSDLSGENRTVISPFGNCWKEVFVCAF